MFIFMDGALKEPIRSKTAAHEYGHTLQSLVFGPLYLFAVGLPSVIWARLFAKRREKYDKRGTKYTSRYPEKQADKLGYKATGHAPVDW